MHIILCDTGSLRGLILGYKSLFGRILYVEYIHVHVAYQYARMIEVSCEATALFVPKMVRRWIRYMREYS